MNLLYGTDLASYQGDPDFDAMKAAGQSFFVTKVSEGIGYANPHFPRSRDEGHRVGLLVGLYHFARNNAPTKEADYFCDTIGQLRPGEFLALDYETIENKDPVNWCRIFLSRVEARTGVKPLLYLYRNEKDNYDWSGLIDHGLWLAAPDGSTDPVDGHPWPFVAIKQYSATGNVSGIEGHVDLDVFYGTADQLAKYGFQGAPVPAPAPEPAPAPPAPPAPAPAGQIVYGERSDRVRRLQEFMVRAFPAYNHYTPTGFYGDLTAAGIAEFQFRVGIVGGDGRNIGPQTTAALERFGFNPYA